MAGGYQSAGLRRRQFARKMKWYIGISITGSILIITAYLVAYSGLFSVKDIKVTGVQAGDEERILAVLRPQVVAGRVGGLLGADNYFSWSNSLVYQDVRSNRVSVEKRLFGLDIEVVVHPRQRYGVWCVSVPEGAVECNWIDAAGVAFEPAPIPEGQLIISMFESASSSAMVLGAPVIDENYFEVIKRVAETLPKLNVPARRIIVDRAFEEVRVDTVSGAVVVFSLRFDPAISALPALKKLIDVPGLASMETIDFTVENRVFYTAR